MDLNDVPHFPECQCEKCKKEGVCLDCEKKAPHSTCKRVPHANPIQCEHCWSNYEGLLEVDEYCTKCGDKKE